MAAAHIVIHMMTNRIRGPEDGHGLLGGPRCGQGLTRVSGRPLVVVFRPVPAIPKESLVR
jgi:hypothetical protein